MNTDFKSAAIVSAITLLAVAAVLFVVSRRIGSSDAHYMEQVATRGLREFYSELKAKTAAPETSKVTVPTADLRAVLLTSERYKNYFPFVKHKEDIFIATPQIEFGSTNLICVVRLNQQTLWGIDGTGELRGVGDSEYQRWPHVGLVME